MITGTVNAAIEAMIRVVLRSAGGVDQEVEVIVDTGFDGFLTLPSATLAALGYPVSGHSRITMADGSQGRVPLYDVTVVWDGQPRTVEVIDLASRVALVGMSMLKGHELRIEAVDGGAVTITELP